MSHFLRRAALAAAVAASGVLGAPSPRVQAAGPVLDGLRGPDEGYQVLAQDPAGDLAADFNQAAPSDTRWADLTSLSVATDTTHLWVYVDLPQYSTLSTGEFGLAIDSDGLADSGGASDPWGYGITFAYTSTHNDVGATPVTVPQALLPDFVVRGRFYSLADGEDGWTELHQWQAISSTWTGDSVNWGGVHNSPTGTHIAFAYGQGLEISLPFSDLGISPTQTLHLEFYATGPAQPSHPPMGAWDTLPSDAQAADADAHAATTQRRLATFNAMPTVAFSAAHYAGFEAAGSVPITLTVSPASSSLISVTLATANGSATAADYLPLSQVFTFAPGATSRSLTLHVLTDTLTESDETVLLSLSQPANAQLGQPVTATLTIHDSPPASTRKLFLPMLEH